MRSLQDIESFLERVELPYEQVGEDTMWLVRDPGLGQTIIVTLAEPLLLFRVKVLDLEQTSDAPGLYKQLLQLNASDLVHGAYGVADDAVVLTCALQLENLDFNEFQAALDDFSLALGNHRETLSKYWDAAKG